MTIPFRLLAARHLPSLALAVCGLFPSASPADTAADRTDPATVLITGSSRGIGLAFAGYYAQQGWQVIATCRSPDRATELQALATDHDNLEVAELDISDAADIAALAERLAGRPIDVLINNAAMLGELAPQAFGQLDYELFEQMLRTNLVGPLRVSEALLDNVAASRQRKIIFLGSAAGSNGLLRPGSWLYAYRASKAGLHLAVHELAIDLAPRGIVVGLLNPGIVDTKGLLDRKPGEPVPEVFRPLMPLIESGQMKVIRPAEAAATMAELIGQLGPERAGRFLNVDGRELPW